MSLIQKNNFQLVIACKTRKFLFVFPLIFVFLTIFLSSCNNCNPNPNRVQNPVRVGTTTVLTVDSLFESTGNTKLDSLLQLAAVTPQDTNLVNLYRQIAAIYMDNNFDKAIEYYIRIYELSDQLDWNKGRYAFFAGYPYVLLRVGLIDSAITVVQRGLELTRNVNNEEWIAMQAANAAQIYNVKEWFETSLQYHIEALPFFEKKNDPKLLAQLYSRIGYVYQRINLTDKSIEFCEKAFALDADDLYILYFLAEAYTSALQYEKANFYFEEALRLSIQQHNLYMAGTIYKDLLKISMQVFTDMEKAELYAKNALDLNKEIGNTGAYCESLMLWGGIEGLRGNISQSEKLAKEALHLAIELDELGVQRSCYINLAELSFAQRNYPQNLHYWNKVDSIDKVIAKETTLRASAEMEAKYETEKKEFEIERQQHIISRQNVERIFLAAGIMVSVVILFLLWRLLRLRNRSNKALTERNDALAEMNATKDKFFNIISHDIKNPAIAQRDALKRLVKNALLWDADTLAKYYDGLLESAEGQVELVYNLLGWAQLQTGRMIFKPTTFNLAASLRSDISLIRGMAEKKGITFTTQIPEDADVTGDSNMITAVVRNLLSNAVKFTCAGGTVMLEIKEAPSNSPEGGASPLSFGEGSGVRLISVSDTGIGMSQEQIDNLFRLDVAHSRRGTAGEQGSGLGLVVCKELLEKHNTFLHVESEAGKGSRFWFTI